MIMPILAYTIQLVVGSSLTCMVIAKALKYLNTRQGIGYMNLI